GLERGAVLPHDRDFAGAGERNDRDVIGLLDRVIDLRRRAAGEFHLARDEAHPRRHRRGAARAYARPFHAATPPTVIAGHSASRTRVNALMTPASHPLGLKYFLLMDAGVNGVPADFIGGVPRPGHDGMDGSMLVDLIPPAPSARRCAAGGAGRWWRRR